MFAQNERAAAMLTHHDGSDHRIYRGDPMATENPTRTCRKCGIPQCESDFTKCPNGKPSFECKRCAYARTRAWAISNADKTRAIKAQHYRTNIDRIREQSRLYKEANRDHINARYRRQYRENREPFVRRAERRYERSKQVGGVFTATDLRELWARQDGLCANDVCRADLGVTGFHNDHKTPVVRGGSHNPENRQLLCPRCNHKKGTKTNEEWVR